MDPEESHLFYVPKYKCKEYNDRLIKSNSMDFDDLLMKTNELLNNYPEVLAKYQEKFKYILVDEYQDN